MSNLASDLPVGMTDLEEDLRGPEAVEIRDQSVETLEAAIRRLHADMTNGLGPEDYANATRIREALAVARSLLIAYPVKS